MSTSRAIVAGSTAIICTTTTRIVACRCSSSERVWESASWHSVSAITGAAITRVVRGTVDRAIGCTGRCRRVARGPRSGRIRRHDPIHPHGRDRPRVRGRPWIDRHPVDPLRVTGIGRRLRAMGAGHRAQEMGAVRHVPGMATGRLRVMGTVQPVPGASAAPRLRVMEDGLRDRIAGRRRTKKPRAKPTRIAFAGRIATVERERRLPDRIQRPSRCAASLAQVPFARPRLARGIAYGPRR